MFRNFFLGKCSRKILFFRRFFFWKSCLVNLFKRKWTQKIQELSEVSSEDILITLEMRYSQSFLLFFLLSLTKAFPVLIKNHLFYFLKTHFSFFAGFDPGNIYRQFCFDGAGPGTSSFGGSPFGFGGGGGGFSFNFG